MTSLDSYSQYLPALDPAENGLVARSYGLAREMLGRMNSMTALSLQTRLEAGQIDPLLKGFILDRARTSDPKADINRWRSKLEALLRCGLHLLIERTDQVDDPSGDMALAANNARQILTNFESNEASVATLMGLFIDSTGQITRMILSDGPAPLPKRPNETFFSMTVFLDDEGVIYEVHIYEGLSPHETRERVLLQTKQFLLGTKINFNKAG